MTVADLLRAAGPLLWVLVALSFYVVYLTVLRWQVLRRLDRDPTPTFTQVQIALFGQGLDAAQREAAKLDTPAGNILWVGLERAPAGPEAASAAMNEATLAEDARLYAGLGTLGVVAQIAPLIGLLGTVLGMVRSFLVFSATAQPTPTQLGQGISEALVNTAAGLIVAILAYLARNALRARADAIALSGERARETLMSLLPDLGAQQERHARPAAPIIRVDFDKPQAREGAERRA